jgi:hypothetical protein
MIFEHGCCQAAAAAHTGVKFLYNKKKAFDFRRQFRP